jgi:hypothetical protein
MGLLADDLLAITDQVARRISLLAIRSFMLAPVAPSSGKNNNFAVPLLEDGTVVITYVALDDAAPELQSRLPGLALEGRDVSTVAHLYAESAGWQRALGLAAINAISQVVLNQSGVLSAMPDNLSVLNFHAGDKQGRHGWLFWPSGRAIACARHTVDRHRAGREPADGRAGYGSDSGYPTSG